MRTGRRRRIGNRLTVVAVPLGVFACIQPGVWLGARCAKLVLRSGPAVILVGMYTVRPSEGDC